MRLSACYKTKFNAKKSRAVYVHQSISSELIINEIYDFKIIQKTVKKLSFFKVLLTNCFVFRATLIKNCPQPIKKFMTGFRLLQVKP